MKILIVIFNLVLIGQVTGQQYFDRVIPSSEYYVENIYCQALLNIDNEIGSFVLSEFREKYGRVNKICKIDVNGCVKEFSEYLDSINPEAIFALKKSSSGYLTSGYKFRSRDTINHFWFAKLNEQFDTLWTKSLQKKYNNSSFNNIIELKNKNIGLCGTDMKVRPSGTFLATIPVIAIADSLGDIIHYTEIRGTDTKAGEGFFGITEGLDNSIYASGYIVRSDILDQDPLIAKVSPEGELMWRRQIDNKGFNEVFVNVFSQEDGSILGIGASFNADDASNVFSYVLLINFDKDGNINWTKRIHKGYNNENYNCVQDNKGNLTCNGSYKKSKAGIRDGWINKFTSNGESLWARVISHSDSIDERFNNISQAPDGGFYLTGYSWIPNDYSSKAWIVKTDSFGCVVPGCEKVVGSEDIKSGKEKAFVKFPNPVTERFFFLSRITVDEPLQMLIHNLQGELVQTYKFRAYEGHQYQVDLKEDIPSGLYNVTIVNAKGMVLFSEKLEVVN